MRSKFAIAGHPIHPALVALPIGLLTWALVANIIYLIDDRDQMWYDIAYWSSIAGVVTALVAAVPGFVDYFMVARHTDAVGIATGHMIQNLIVVALFTVAAILMYDDGARDGGSLATVVVLQALGVGILGLSGWLGGEMVFRHHIGVVPDDGAAATAEEARHVARPATERR
jgi:uncharacterized membrane protein